ncbi:ABC transporter ATP-binding protein [Amycolatopsis pithecellobii]|uniref:sn-glycerol-3-phosphate ABC transporter ATP-binding protein UgpC n=1 Tax=Amycolatopsis pithecellobii TaxID=664692 RepID=A0A6N7YR79_9PSEU|nr:ABC transporter ATP-binding protein [Amycolatopsis pithecellobii]MTD54398.1 sn-glycerol-3-phosphate ABC transporter ATP-binding protein UgpC [Amycolatopsis pithecellobii]
MGQIRIRGATKRFGAVTAVDGVSIDIADGEFLVLLGPSGCGKSTLLRAIAGLAQLDAGALELDGRDITHVPPRDRDLAMVFQSYALYPHLSVERNIGFPLRARRRPRKEIDRKVADVATTLELTELLRRRPRELSGGQRQRVALGRALVRDPGAFLMDEPLSNLDAKLRASTRYELVELHRRLRGTFVYVTHDQVEAMTMATRIAILNAGRLEQVGTPAEVYDEPASTFVAGFLGSPPMNLVRAKVSSRGPMVFATAPDIDVALGLPGQVPETEVVLGIRPEHLRTHDARPGIEGVVRLVENLGAEEIAHCDVGPARVAVRGPRPLRLSPGEPVKLSVEPDHLHLFHPDTGRRLRWQDDPVPSRSEQGVLA